MGEVKSAYEWLLITANDIKRQWGMDRAYIETHTYKDMYSGKMIHRVEVRIPLCEGYRTVFMEEAPSK